MAEQHQPHLADPKPDYAFETRAIHAGQDPDPQTGAVIVPIYQTSTYAQAALGDHKGFEYSRTDNPTRQALQTCIASLEGGRYGLAFASGMAAETTLMYMFQPGDHLVVSNDVYGGTYRLFERVLAGYGICFSYVDLTEPEALEAAWTPRPGAVWIETPSNPLMKLIDIAAAAEVAHAHGGRVVVDNTFASPYGQQPLALGADVVIHSATKYLGGHSDVVGGLLVLDDETWYERLKYLQNAAGSVPGPFDCWLTLRGIKTLAVRMERHCANARLLAAWLAEQPQIRRVYYPGLPSHPNHDLARRQMRDFGGMISVSLKGG